ncbi:MAG: hypothetical protein ABJA98_32385 [Acidobacteriota bacterium]
MLGTAALKNAGLTAPHSLIKAYDIDGGVGGPIRKDRLWYFVTGRAQGSDTYVTSLYYNQNAGNPAVWTDSLVNRIKPSLGAPCPCAASS